ncbi:unnamed protein product, partial [Ectocarpus sp. 4 AP-2014]
MSLPSTGNVSRVPVSQEITLFFRPIEPNGVHTTSCTGLLLALRSHTVSGAGCTTSPTIHEKVLTCRYILLLWDGTETYAYLLTSSCVRVPLRPDAKRPAFGSKWLPPSFRFVTAPTNSRERTSDRRQSR